MFYTHASIDRPCASQVGMHASIIHVHATLVCAAASISPFCASLVHAHASLLCENACIHMHASGLDAHASVVCSKRMTRLKFMCLPDQTFLSANYIRFVVCTCPTQTSCEPAHNPRTSLAVWMRGNPFPFSSSRRMRSSSGADSLRFRPPSEFSTPRIASVPLMS